MLFQSAMLAENRFTFEPAIEVTEVHDDNLFFSRDAAAGDLILRVKPALGLQFAYPRLSALESYEIADDRYATYSHLSNRLARQGALARIDYRVSPRLSFGLDGAFTDTDTPSEFNVDTGLAAGRTRARRLMMSPTGRFRISPRLSAHASLTATNDKLSNGNQMRSQFFAGGIEERLTPRDSFALDYEHGHYDFQPAAQRSSTATDVLRGTWSHDLNARTHVTLAAGPRVTDGIVAPELAASLTHRWMFGSITISGLQTQTSAIGLGDIVQVRSVDARLMWTPSRSLSAYAGPAIFRNARRGLEATVYQIVLGARYAVTPWAGFDVEFSRDSQHGAIDPVRVLGGLSRSVLSVGFTSRWRAH
jgi:hypothetical protein